MSGAVELELGALGFGGPMALAGYLQRDLVEDRRCLRLWALGWYSAEAGAFGFGLQGITAP